MLLTQCKCCGELIDEAKLFTCSECKNKVCVDCIKYVDHKGLVCDECREEN